MNEQEIYDLFIELFHKVYVPKCPKKTYEDRLCSAAHALFMENVCKIESMHPYITEFDDDGIMWYDYVRVEMILKYCDLIEK